MASWNNFFKRRIPEKEEIEIEHPEEKGRKTIKGKTKEELKEHINTDKMNSYQTTLTQDTNHLGKMDYKIQAKYEELLKDKITDKKLRKEIIEQSELVLKERCTMTIVLEGDDPTNKGMIEIIGILPEYEQQIKEYFMGRYIHYQEWKQTIDGFKIYLNTQAKDVKSINTKMPIKEDLEIKRIQINCTFK